MFRKKLSDNFYQLPYQHIDRNEREKSAVFGEKRKERNREKEKRERKTEIKRQRVCEFCPPPH